MLAWMLPLAEELSAAEEGRRIIFGMLVVGLIFVGVILLGQASRWAAKRRGGGH
jgi:hypothetical protein